MKNLLSKMCCNKDIGLVLIRIALGSVFIVHGIAKVMDLQGTLGFFGSLGIPAILTYLVVVIEIFGGVMVLLGIYARIAAILIAFVMIGAIVTVKWSQGFSGGWEFDFVLLLNALALALIGSGSCSLVRKDVCCCGENCGSKTCDVPDTQNSSVPVSNQPKV